MHLILVGLTIERLPGIGATKTPARRTRSGGAVEFRGLYRATGSAGGSCWEITSKFRARTAGRIRWLAAVQTCSHLVRGDAR